MSRARSFTERKKSDLERGKFKKGFKTIEEVLDYLNTPANFKSLPEVLTDAMIEAEVITDNADEKEKIRALRKAFKEKQVYADLTRESIRKGLAEKKPDFAGEIAEVLHMTEEETHQFLMEWESADNDGISVIRNALAERNLCVANASDKEVRSVLYELYKENGKGSVEKTADKVLGDWVTGGKYNKDRETPGFYYLSKRENALKIAYALGMSLEQTDEFLTKCGFAILQARSALDAIHMCCLAKHVPYCEARELYDLWLEEAEPSNPKQEQESDVENTELLGSEKYDGSAEITVTRRIENKIDSVIKENWSKEEFLNQYLIPKRELFENYSHRALTEYYTIKNLLTLNILKYETKWYSNDDRSIKKVGKLIKDSDDNKLIQESFPYAWRIWSALYDEQLDNKAQMEAAFGTSTLHTLFLDKENRFTPSKAKSVVDCMEKAVKKRNNESDQLYFSGLFKKIISNESLAAQTLSSITEKRKRADGIGKSSKLPEKVRKNFFSRFVFNEIEANPSTMYETDQFRKAILLISYMLYGYQWVMKMNHIPVSMVVSSIVELDDVLDFETFYNTLNNTLHKCRLGSLYVANPFDWLVLRAFKECEELDERFANDISIRDYHNRTDMNENYTDPFENPLLFINELISQSYEK